MRFVSFSIKKAFESDCHVLESMFFNAASLNFVFQFKDRLLNPILLETFEKKIQYFTPFFKNIRSYWSNFWVLFKFLWLKTIDVVNHLFSILAAPFGKEFVGMVWITYIF